MAVNNPMSIKNAVDQVIGTYGSRIKEIGVGDDWKDFCDEIGHDPDVEPVTYRDTTVRRSADALEVRFADWR